MTSATDVAVVGAGLSREAAIRAWQAHGIDRWCWRPARSRRLVAGLQRQPEVVLPGWLQRHAGATRQPSGKARPAPRAGPSRDTDGGHHAGQLSVVLRGTP